MDWISCAILVVICAILVVITVALARYTGCNSKYELSFIFLQVLTFAICTMYTLARMPDSAVAYFFTQRVRFIIYIVVAIVGIALGTIAIRYYEIRWASRLALILIHASIGVSILVITNYYTNVPLKAVPMYPLRSV